MGQSTHKTTSTGAGISLASAIWKTSRRDGRINRRKYTKNDLHFLDFQIVGNASDPSGNPKPKIKMTKNQYWTPKAQEYSQWKQYVIATFLKTMEKDKRIYPTLLRNMGLYQKPLTTSSTIRARMDIDIEWGSGVHGDAENVFGSIADALFKQDKYLNGSFNGDDALDKVGKVNVFITLIDFSTGVII